MIKQSAREQQVTSSVVVEIEKNTERHCRSDARSNHQDLQFLIFIQIPFSLLIQNPNFLFSTLQRRRFSTSLTLIVNHSPITIQKPKLCVK